MANWRLDRFLFWGLVLVYFVIENWLIQCEQQDLAAGWGWLLFLALAFVVGARLNDAGFNRLIQYIGIGATGFITTALPPLLQFGKLSVFRRPAEASCSKPEFANLFSTFNFVPFVLLLALLIWAGTRPRAPQLLTSSSGSPPTM
jgi:hypothetical protein